MGSLRSAVRPRTRWKLGAIGLSGALVALGLGSLPSTAAPRAASSPITYFSVTVLQPNARPFWITPGPDGNMWFTDTNGDRIGRITLDGKIKLFKVEKGSKPYTIVAGPDGNLWFTEWRNNSLGVMDVHGHYLHRYPVASSDMSPYGIAVSPDGYIWFTAYNFEDPSAINRVGRMSTDGEFVERYELAPCACDPLGVTAGPDGNMWVTEELGAFDGTNYGSVDRVSLDGKDISRFQMPDVQSLPAWIAPGPDGRLWFGQYNAEHHKLGRISTDGDITNFHINDAVSNTVDATTGPDRKIWFTEGDANDIWSMKPNGALVDNFSTGVHATPAGITTGPDGNLWFAVAGSGEIGRLHVARPGTRSVLDIASGFAPRVRTARLGNTVQWMLEAPGMHGVRDSTGLDLYNSGLRPPVSFLKFAFRAAGTYPYRDRGSDHRGTIRMPVDSPARGRVGHPFEVRWALPDVPVSQVFDVQVRRPGSHSWHDLRDGTSVRGANFTPHREGRYAFRARLRDEGSGRHSGWSPPRAVFVR
jgi:streptogramin lyase